MRGGWRLVGVASLGIAAMVAAVLAVEGTDRAGVHALLRATARSSLILFVLAFTASSLHRLVRRPATAWLLRNRRYIGVSFGVSHLVHLGAIVTTAVRWPAEFWKESGSLAVLVGGGSAYLFLGAMLVTSFDRPTAWLGRRWWRRLHLTGSWILWVVFAQTYVARAIVAPVFAPLAVITVGAAGIRAAAWWRSRRSRKQ